MTLRVHFRGVGVYVANDATGRITEILFPNTTSEPQDGTKATKVSSDTGKDPKPRIPKTYRHADGSSTVQHFPGAILKAKDGTEKFFDLNNATIVRNPAGAVPGAIMDSAFTTLIPPLDEIVIPLKQLRLLKNRDESKRVTTRFFLAGDDLSEINTIEPSAASHHDWIVASANGARNAAPYRLEGLWTLEAPAVVFQVFDLGKPTPGTQRDTISMNDKWPDLYIFNSDIEQPTVDQLIAVKDASPGIVDNDFKWAYQLFQKKDSDWHKWLNGNQFPAPILIAKRSFKLHDDRLPSVSTCFQVVWTGDNER